MGQIPATYPIQPSEATASFDYADIQEGTGVTVYSLARTEISGGTQAGILTRNNLYSVDMEVSGGNASGMITDYDYDVVFARPQNIKGTAYANICHKLLPSGGASTSYLVVHLRHWDGTTETTLATATSKTLSSAAAAQGIVQLLPLPISLKHFKKDETLRLTVEAWSSGTNGSYGYGVDPKARTESWMTLTGQSAFTSQSTISVPFVLKI